MIDPTSRPSGTGCAECEADGTWWFHLRRCAACGHIGCCDDSLRKHATAHFRETGHAIEVSFEPGEDWAWSYVLSDYVEMPVLAEPRSHPEEQPVPGPASRVPADWVEQLQAQPS
jgi:hypothetical protein